MRRCPAVKHGCGAAGGGQWGAPPQAVLRFRQIDQIAGAVRLSGDPVPIVYSSANIDSRARVSSLTYSQPALQRHALPNSGIPSPIPPQGRTRVVYTDHCAPRLQYYELYRNPQLLIALFCSVTQQNKYIVQTLITA